jgi:nucleoside-diphosphate-sugar epimerase
MNRVLVTGGSGFVGRHRALTESRGERARDVERRGRQLRRATRILAADQAISKEEINGQETISKAYERQQRS